MRLQERLDAAGDDLESDGNCDAELSGDENDQNGDEGGYSGCVGKYRHWRGGRAPGVGCRLLWVPDAPRH